jgi:hypothetical protein
LLHPGKVLGRRGRRQRQNQKSGAEQSASHDAAF